MITLSLLENIEEIKYLKVMKLSVRFHNRERPDLEWIAKQYTDWSKQYSRNETLDNTLIWWLCRWHFWTDSSVNIYPTKERVVSAIKMIEIGFYIDHYLKPVREERSAEKAEIIINILLDALKSGRSDHQMGKRLIDALSDVKSQVNHDQWCKIENDVEMCLRGHLDLNCNYWLKNKFIEFDSYLEKRCHESSWNLVIRSVEYLFESAVPKAVECSVQSYVQKCTELCLAIDDHYISVTKLMTNDITSRVFSYANHYKCSVQEAIDNQFEYTNRLYAECQELRDQLIVSEEADHRFEQYIRAILITAESATPLITELLKLKVEKDLTVWSMRWPQIYRFLRDNSTC